MAIIFVEFYPKQNYNKVINIMKTLKNIAILCSGGDVSGMNPALKRFVEYTYAKNLVPYFVKNGYEGLIDNEISQAYFKDVSGIISRGGTKIHSARSSRFIEKKYRDIAQKNLATLDIDALIVLGGDGSFKGLDLFSKEGSIRCCGIPSTIDNDIGLTDYTLGVDTALNIIKGAIDAVRDTASSFKRAFVIETMGRDCGYLAITSALTSGAEMCLIPEVEYDLNEYEINFKKQIKQGRNYFIAIVSESFDNAKEISDWFENSLGFESRVTTLGHIQRGGNPSSYDRLMAYQFITHAIDGLLDYHNNFAICYSDSHFKKEKLSDVVTTKHELNHHLITFAKALNQR